MELKLGTLVTAFGPTFSIIFVCTTALERLFVVVMVTITVLGTTVEIEVVVTMTVVGTTVEIVGTKVEV